MKKLVLPPPPGNRNFPEACDIVHRLRDAGHTFEAIATFLNEHGYTTKRGKRFNPATVRQIHAGWILRD